MKILHTEASCGWGGQEIRILEESRGLIGRGHQVMVACPPHARMAEEASRYGVPVISLPIEFKTFAGFMALRRHLAGGGYDVVNTHSSTDSWLTALACATLPCPPAIVRTRHISAPVSGNFANRWLYRQAKVVVTTGEALRKDLIARLALPADKVVSIPTGIDTERFSPPADKAEAKRALGLDPSLRYIGIVATLRSWKGHLFLLDAFAQLDRPDLRLLIVGDGPMRTAIENKVAELELKNFVILVGQRNDPERWLQAMDVFCLPSYANEGVPQAILQAMLCALPIVTTPVGAILEAVRDGESAMVVPPKDASVLAAAIGQLVDNPVLSANLGEKARRAAEAEFSREAMLNRMEKVFFETNSQQRQRASELKTLFIRLPLNARASFESDSLCVGLLTPTFLPNLGGAQVGLHNIAQRLSARGHRPVVVTASHYCRQIKALGWKLPYKVVGLPRRPWRWIERYPRLVFFLLDLQLSIVEKRFGIQCWHGTLAFPTGVALVHHGIRRRMPHLVRCAGDDIQVDVECGYGHRQRTAVDHLIREWLPQAQCVVAISESVVKEYRHLGIPEAHIARIPNGVDLQRFQNGPNKIKAREILGLPEGVFIFLSVGRNHPKKNFDTVIRAFSQLPTPVIAGSRLMFVGRDLGSLKPVAAAAGVADKVIYFNELGGGKRNPMELNFPADELVAAYRAADAFVFPSRVETFGIVLIEAMAAGLPVITSDAPGCRDIAEGGCYAQLVAPENINALALAMTKLATSTDEYNYWATLSAIRARNYDWNIVVDNYIKTYRALINGRYLPMK